MSFFSRRFTPFVLVFVFARLICFRPRRFRFPSCLRCGAFALIGFSSRWACRVAVRSVPFVVSFMSSRRNGAPFLPARFLRSVLPYRFRPVCRLVSPCRFAVRSLPSSRLSSCRAFRVFASRRSSCHASRAASCFLIVFVASPVIVHREGMPPGLASRVESIGPSLVFLIRPPSYRYGFFSFVGSSRLAVGRYRFSYPYAPFSSARFPGVFSLRSSRGRCDFSYGTRGHGREEARRRRQG